MNVREEDRQKNTCPSRGLGLAAAAIGVGVGAALYYFFSKRPENPDGEGSTSLWNTEEPQVLGTPLHDDSDSYTTISEHSTTDTSMEESDNEDSSTEYESHNSSESEASFLTSPSSVRTVDNTFDFTIETSSESDIGMEWDITNVSLDVPEDVRSPLLWYFNSFHSPSPGRQRTRERSWSLEECSICFDVILKDQQVTTLPCTHHFHSHCITPWLQEQQTCPNCRKSAE